MLKIRQLLIYSYVLLMPLDNFDVLPISLSNLTLMILFGIYIIEGFKIKIKNVSSKFLLPILFIFLFIVFNNLINIILNSYDTSKINGIAFYIFIILFFIFALDERNKISLKNMFKVTLISIFISVFFGYAEYFAYTFKGIFIFSNPVITLNGIRIKGTYFDPNYFAIMASFGIVLSIDTIENKIFKWLFALYFVSSIILTQSRMGLLAIILYIVIRYGINKRIKSLYYLLATIIGVFATNLAYEKIVNYNMASTNMRLDLIMNSLFEIANKPITGYGYGHRVDIGAYILETHNTYLQILLDGGLILFLITIVPLFISMIQIIFKYRNKDNFKMNRYRIIVICSSLLLLFQINFLSYFYIKYFWLIYFFVIKYIVEFQKEKEQRLNLT